MKTLQEGLDSLSKALLPTSQWTPCPVCNEEWNKLRPGYYSMSSEVRTTFLCGRCAEGGKRIAFDWLEINFPIPGAVVTGREDFRLWEIAAGGMKFKVRGQSYRPYVVHCRIGKETDEVFSDNIVSAWMKIKAEVEKGDDPKDLNNTWDRREKKRLDLL